MIWTAWKGAGVALLAVWAALNAHNRDGWLVAAVMALGALGDVLLERSQTGGALAFLAGHIVAIVLYLLHRRSKPSPSQIALSALLLIAVPLIAFLLPADRGAAPGIAVYATGLGAMAASAWLSRFPRYRVGLGAVMFVASDLLIFSRMGPLANSLIPRLLIWPLYFAGQALIAWGAVTALLRWKDDEDLHHRL
ncbi:MAG TPA: lysoplasmalogenase [Sphingomonas sp.]